MKNLEIFGVKELNRKEREDLGGGVIGAIFLATLIIAGPMLGWANGRKHYAQP